MIEKVHWKQQYWVRGFLLNNLQSTNSQQETTENWLKPQWKGQVVQCYVPCSRVHVLKRYLRNWKYTDDYCNTHWRSQVWGCCKCPVLTESEQGKKVTAPAKSQLLTITFLVRSYHCSPYSPFHLYVACGPHFISLTTTSPWKKILLLKSFKLAYHILVLTPPRLLYSLPHICVWKSVL